MRRRHLSATASPLGARRRLAVTRELPEAGRECASLAAAPSGVSYLALESRRLPAAACGVGWGEGPLGWGRGSPHSSETTIFYAMERTAEPTLVKRN